MPDQEERAAPPAAPRSELTVLLRSYADGREEAFDDLFSVVYNDLKRIARNHLRSEADGHTLNTTALVHESYLNLADGTVPRDRAHFFALASRVMRNILVDYARAKGTAKRGGDVIRVELQTNSAATSPRTPELVALHQALERLGQHDERMERVVECKIFGGMTTKEIAEAVGVAVRTVEKDWTMAKAFLHRELDPHRSVSK